MRVLVTGSRGKIGSAVSGRLCDDGFDVVELDLARGEDVRDFETVRAASSGCDATVHLAAIVRDDAEPVELMRTNLLGTWNVLHAAASEGLGRVVFFSSVNALGVFMGHREPDYLPLDDDHASYARRPYGLSKRLAEETCRAFTEETGVPTISLRLPGVLAPSDCERLRARRAADPESEWTPFWEYGAFLDVRDAAEAAYCALTCPDPGHVRLLLCAEDISATRPARELVERLLPRVEWRGGEEYELDPYRALIDTSRGRAVLGWRPRVRWRDAVT